MEGLGFFIVNFFIFPAFVGIILLIVFKSGDKARENKIKTKLDEYKEPEASNRTLSSIHTPIQKNPSTPTKVNASLRAETSKVEKADSNEAKEPKREEEINLGVSSIPEIVPVDVAPIPDVIDSMASSTQEDMTKEGNPKDLENTYDERGFNGLGYHKNGTRRDNDGFDIEGYNIFGYDKEGFDKEGYDRLGYNREGYDREGYDKNGYNKDGIDRFGLSKNY